MANIVVDLFILLNLAFAVVAIVASCISLEIYLQYVGNRSTLGESAMLSSDFHGQLIWRLRLVATLAACVGVTAWVFRRRLSRRLLLVTIDAGEFSRQTLGLLRRWCRGHRATLGWLLVIVFLAVCLRGYNVTRDYRSDELNGVKRFVMRSWPVAISFYKDPQNHLLETVLGKTSVMVFGHSLLAVRLPVLVAGTALVVLVFALTRVLFRRDDAALLAAGLTAGHGFLIEYSVNARGYMLQAALVVTLLLLSQYLRKRNARSGWVFWAALMALGFYAVPTMLYPATVLVGWLLLEAARGQTPRGDSRRRQAVRIISATGLAAVFTLYLYLPVIAASGPENIVANRWVTPLARGEWWDRLVQMLGKMGAAASLGVPGWVMLLLGAGFLTFLFSARTRYGKSMLMWLIVLVLVAPTMLFCQRLAPFVRTWLWLLPIALVFASGGLGVWLAWMQRHRLATARYALVMVVVASVTGQVLASQCVWWNHEGGVLFQSEAIAAHLTASRRTGEPVISKFPTTWILIWPMKAADPAFSPATVEDVDDQTTTAWIVVNDFDKQTLDEFLLQLAAQRPGWIDVTCTARFDHASVYRVTW